jgi:multidrug efflux pump subunit AcrB
MVPMAFVGQMMGQFMKPIPANVPVALVASLFVAYIFTPYLAVRLLKKPGQDGETH